MRKLASIKRIDDVRPIEGADAIECAVIGGWTVVIKKDEYKVGDLAVYCEIDSWIPNELAPFLSKGHEPREFNGVKGERLRTVKLRGQLSQGLLLPLGVLAVKTEHGNYLGDWDQFEGHDVSERLNIQKWEPTLPTQLQGQAEGAFPTFIHKTDQERAQNLVSEVKEAFDNGEEFEATIKLDGSSCTVFLKDGDLGVCSRNWRLKINDENKDNSFVRAMFDTGLDIALNSIGRNVAVQGEVMGPGVQGNRENLQKIQLYIFDVFDIDAQRYMTPSERRAFVEKLIDNGYHGEHCPIISESMKLPTGNVEELLLFAEGPSLKHAIREGIVWKSTSRDFSFKTISNKFLLKGGN